MFQKKGGNEEKNEGAHMWALCRGQARTPFHHIGYYSTLSPGQL